jgi:osmotically-inducible protein OsmY
MTIRINLLSCILAGSAVAGLSACSTQAEAAVGSPVTAPQIADVDVTTNVHTAFHRDPVLRAFVITVVTTKGDVRLTGALDTQAQIDVALALARTSGGVHTIHNELTLKK